MIVSFWHRASQGIVALWVVLASAAVCVMVFAVLCGGRVGMPGQVLPQVGVRIALEGPLHGAMDRVLPADLAGEPALREASERARVAIATIDQLAPVSPVDAELGLSRISLRESPAGGKQWRVHPKAGAEGAWLPVLGVRGRVLGAVGADPVYGTVFLARQGGGDVDPFVRQIRFGSDGVFQLPEVYETGSVVLIAVRDDGACSEPQEVSLEPEGGREVLLHLRSAAPCEVRLAEAYPGPCLVRRVCGLDAASGARIALVPTADGRLLVPDHGGGWALWPEFPNAPGLELAYRSGSTVNPWHLPARCRLLVRWNGVIGPTDEVVVRCVVYALDAKGGWRSVLTERFPWSADSAPTLALLPGSYRLRLDALGCESFLSEVLDLGPGDSALVDGRLRLL